MNIFYTVLIIIGILLGLIVIIFLSVTINCFFKYNSNKKSKHYKNILDPYINFLYDKKRHIILSKLFKRLLKVFNKNKLDWWMMGGSLLGTERHAGFIPWDDDIDIGITSESLKKLSNINLAKYGLFLREVYTYAGHYYQMYFLKDKDRPYISINTNNLTVPFIDIIPFNLEKNKYIPEAFTKQWFLKKNLFPLKNKLFHNITVKVPNNYINYLDRIYNNWDEDILIYLPHNLGLICPIFCINKTKITPKIQKLFYEHSRKNPL